MSPCKGLIFNEEISEIHIASSVQTAVLSRVFEDKETTHNLVGVHFSPAKRNQRKFHESTAGEAFNFAENLGAEKTIYITDGATVAKEIMNNPDRDTIIHVLCVAHLLLNLMWKLWMDEFRVIINGRRYNPREIIRKIGKILLPHHDIHTRNTFCSLQFLTKFYDSLVTCFNLNREKLEIAFANDKDVQFTYDELLPFFGFIQALVDISNMLPKKKASKRDIIRLQAIVISILQNVHHDDLLFQLNKSIKLYLLVCEHTRFPPPLLIMTVMYSYGLIAFILGVQRSRHLALNNLFKTFKETIHRGREIDAVSDKFGTIRFTFSPLESPIIKRCLSAISPTATCKNTPSILAFLPVQLNELNEREVFFLKDLIAINQPPERLLVIQRIIALCLFVMKNQKRSASNVIAHFDLNFFKITLPKDFNLHTETVRILNYFNNVLFTNVR
jgi:hypothetical protein